MGSPLAPVLCALVAAEQEFLTIRSLRAHLADAGLLRSFRYADNRCFFLRRSELRTDWTRLLFRLDFYGLPIELENVPGEELLGSIASTQQRTITMQQPANETTLRSLGSAGSKSEVEDLIEIYRRRGFEGKELLQLASRFRAYNGSSLTLRRTLSMSFLPLSLSMRVVLSRLCPCSFVDNSSLPREVMPHLNFNCHVIPV